MVNISANSFTVPASIGWRAFRCGVYITTAALASTVDFTPDRRRRRIVTR
jgi:hypothetical protein